MKLEKRSSFGWPATAAGSAACSNGLVVHYDGSDQGLAGKGHQACRTYWKDTRKFHMGPERGWLDIGYSFGVCPHGYVLEGRGWQRQQAAQPGGNSTWTSCTFMSGDHETPTDAQVDAFKEFRAWLRGKGLAAAISYHGKFISTSCPGAVLRGMVTTGALSGAPSEEDDVTPDDIAAIAKAVWAYRVNTGKTTAQAKSAVGNTEDDVDEIRKTLAEHGAKIDQILAAVAPKESA